MISQNQDRFVSMLNEPFEEGEPNAQAGGAPQEGAGGFIQVTPQEKEAIDRVCWSLFENRT